jgi:S1-C subfamily serine protease
LQQAHNKGLEEEIRRLHGLLEEDPCSLSGLLGPSPEKSPVAPGYRAPPVSGPTDSPPAPSVPGVLAPQPAPAPATVGDLLAEATVFILASNQSHMGMGSGFLVAPGVVATNSHVALGPDSEIYVGNKALGGMHAARIIAYSTDESRDYALLRIADELTAKVPLLRLGAGAARTERVSAWGFPGYITEIDPNLAALAKGDAKAVPEVVYSEGVVSVVLDRKPPVILHTAAISQGNSGGPLVNAEGIVVGINTFIKIADKSYSQANIALAAGDLALFMKEHGIAPSEAPSENPKTGNAPGREERQEEAGSPKAQAPPASGQDAKQTEQHPPQ